jgi:hypothetical protein
MNPRVVILGCGFGGRFTYHHQPPASTATTVTTTASVRTTGCDRYDATRSATPLKTGSTQEGTPINSSPLTPIASR